MAEIWSIYIGLKLVGDLGYKRVEVETDSSKAVECISKGGNVNMAAGSLVNQIKNLMFDIVDMHHNYREANKCANLLAHEGKKVLGDTIFYGDIPPWLVHLVDGDSSGITSARLIAL
ncbi:uncharacterized protein LOC131614950 [Vicia villosa]|uniref:uncharacterized protein LOC131614950 n=1 Tax=Vicia villosa TaxID=3911 RepID=UPI00273C81BC|nr:uncharacterized protein LOC131614950 [Vicia villosa]